MSFLCRAQTTMSCYVMNFESLLLKELPPNGMTKPLNAIIGVAKFSVNLVSLTKFQVQYAIGNDDEERQLTS